MNYKIGETITHKSFSPKGSLHKESIFGKRTPPNLDTAYHIRKPLESIRTLGQIEKIVDKNVKNAVLKVLRETNLSDSTKFIPPQVFFTTYANGSKKQRFSYPIKMVIRFP